MPIFQPFAFRSSPAAAPGPLPPVGSYVTDNLVNYVDFGTDYDCWNDTTTMANLAPPATAYSDGQYWSGNRINGSLSLNNFNYDPVLGTVQGFADNGGDSYTTNYGNLALGIVNRTTPTNMTFEKGWYPTSGTDSLQMQMGYRSLRLGGGGGGAKVDSRVYFSFYGVGGGDALVVNPQSPLPINQPVIMTFTIANTTGKVYVNGSLVASGTIPSGRRPYNEPYWVGNCAYNVVDASTHRISALTEEKVQYIRYYADKTLTDAEVLQNYNANKARLGLT